MGFYLIFFKMCLKAIYQRFEVNPLIYIRVLIAII